MTFHEIIKGIEAGIQNMSWQEWTAVVFSIISVLCARANSVWVYPFGIAGILFSISIFIQAQYKLYPDAALNGYYLVMSVYGWYIWTRKDVKKHETPISKCSRRELIIASLIFIITWAILYWWLNAYKINNVPMLDSFSSAMACSGMWLLAKRKVENWIALLIADAAAIPLFIIKHLLLFCALNIFYVIIAWLGYLSWMKIYHGESKNMAS